MPSDASMKYIRYTLAALCLASSVGCLALWWWSLSSGDQFLGPRYFSSPQAIYLEVADGIVIVQTIYRSGPPLAGFERAIRMWPSPLQLEGGGVFGKIGDTIYFPLWYPALVFALAGVGILRFGRFTIRSALIVTTIVAVLLGMVVVL
jgi:hypothetical protein